MVSRTVGLVLDPGRVLRPRGPAPGTGASRARWLALIDDRMVPKVRPVVCRAGQVRQAVAMTVGTRPRQRLTLAVACLAQGMMVLDVLIVSVALPAMQHELHLLPAGLEWVVSGYALALAALIPTGGALGDHFGRKRIS
jgi:hypothetical protein